MDALLPLLAGLAALGGAAVVLRSFGPRYRVGRLLASAPKVTVAEAIALATAGRAAYVRIDGRIDSEAEFEDADHRPLVLRRTRFQALDERGWRDLEVVHEVVPFEVREGLDAIAIDGESIAEGLVVVPRESLGVVADLGDRAPADTPADRPARVVVEHVSSVEHAIALGVPTTDAAGRPRLGPGLGRPLILSTLEPAEAMRILAGGSSLRPRLAAALLAAAVVLVVVAVVLFVLPGDALAASPDPTAVTGSDTRSPGEGPGFVGAIVPAFLAVVGIAAAAIVGTLAFVRLTGGRSEPPRRR
ncbi:MAG TPA: hypothetical protein VFX65_12775 [Candidatus Limnocylindrales bacterium]|nr:hypothetical protein [Candidatus Limnocylindrales bacterium]